MFAPSTTLVDNLSVTWILEIFSELFSPDALLEHSLTNLILY